MLGRWGFVAAVALIVGGCGSLAEQTDRFANKHGMTRSIALGAPFQHLLYSRYINASTQTLHVYIEGDGQPWDVGGLLPADDPTPSRPLALHLMAKDDDAALYLGRPCYFDLATQSPCTTRYWTSARYSQQVVTSMATVLNDFTKAGSIRKIVLIGYSGGGALATLIASHLHTEVEVVTIAANLDTDAWTAAHGYLSLDESLNPIQSARLTGISHHHFAGGQDSNISARSVERFTRQHNGRFTRHDAFDHVCCWEDKWPSLLHNANNRPITAGAQATGEGGATSKTGHRHGY